MLLAMIEELETSPVHAGGRDFLLVLHTLANDYQLGNKAQELERC